MERSEPPKWADWFVTQICPEEYLEEVQGDLHEAFHWRAEAKGDRFARRKFYLEALKTIRLFRLKSPHFMNKLNWAALQNYFRTGLRFLWKTRAYSSVNMLGLAIGIASAAMAFLFLSDQYAYDRFHQHADHLYRITCGMEFNGQAERIGGASYIMGEELPKQVPGILRGSHFKSGLALRRIGEIYDYQYLHYSDRALFDMLDFTFVAGNPGDFEQPDQVVISESFAKGLESRDELRLTFGEEERIFQVAGVFKDFPHTSTLQPEVIVPFSLWLSLVPTRRTVNWFDINMNAFVQLKKEAKLEEVVESMNQVFAANFDVTKNKAQVGLQSFTAMHTDDSLELGNGLRAGANKQILWSVLGVGLLCLLIGCFNYSSFALGNFLSRSREVAVRKVMGASRSSIFFQFISESFLSTTIAAVLAIALILIFLPSFSAFIGEEYTVEQLLGRRFVLGLLAVLLMSTLLSGVYPAILLSAKKASTALKQKLKVGGRGFVSWFLVTLQVSLTTFLIIGMLTVGRQLNHLLDLDLGYNDENLLSITILDPDEQRLAQFKRELSQLPVVQGVSANSGYNGTNYVDGDLKFETSHLRADEDFIQLLQIEMAKGRAFDPALATDRKNAVLVNEAFVKKAGLQDPVGQSIPFSYGDLVDPQIIGVIKDYRYDSPKTTLEPLVIYTSPQYQMQDLVVKLDPAVNEVGPLLSRMEELWRGIYPTLPLSYSWLEEQNAANMRTEVQIKKLAMTGSLLAILLASLGLFGVAGTYVRQRLKAVSIRKVNGASPLNIYWLFSRIFGRWLLLGFVLGSIPAVIFLQNWLENYPERIRLDLGIPAISALICSLVFMMIITWLLTKVMFLNPVTYLRDE